MPFLDGTVNASRPAQCRVSVTVCARVAPATALAAATGSATSTTRSSATVGSWAGRDRCDDRVGRHDVRLPVGARCGRRHDVDDVAGPEQIGERPVGDVQRHQPGIGSRCGLRQPGAEQPDIGEDLTAPDRSGRHRADHRPAVRH